jgi:hypothetical protein
MYIQVQICVWFDTHCGVIEDNPDNPELPDRMRDSNSPPGSHEPEGVVHPDLPPDPLAQLPGLPSDIPEQLSEFVPVLEDLITAMKFIELLRSASLDNESEKLSFEVLNQLRNPSQKPLTVEDPDERLSIELFLSVTNASEATYNSVRTAIIYRYPDSRILSYYKVQKLVTQLTGIIPVIRDMCVKSCIAFTGPFADLDCCPKCNEGRYDAAFTNKKVPQKQFYTFPIGPQLQALWRTPEGADSMGYRARYTDKILKELHANGGERTSPYMDFFDGSDYLDAVQNGQISTDDMVLVMSVDGAQLYRNKESECWMWIWLIFNHAPDNRYKKKRVLPAGFMPGPHKPKNTDSFFYTGLYHVAAIQQEGLKIWDARKNTVFKSYIFVALATADGPGMACLNGCVGHSGKFGCRLYCPLSGRHKTGGTHYYPARQKPTGFTVEGCDHPDVDLQTLLENFNSQECIERYRANLKYVMSSANKTQYAERRLETGICKPSIFSGLPSKRILGIPGCFPLDIMHLPALNIPDLFLPLWRGTFECDKLSNDSKDNWEWKVLSDSTVWKTHGQMVANAKPYIPGSFDRPPRNPAEKINSGYKAWEFLLYFYGLGPALLFRILPDKYWVHYCKLVRGIRILLQEEIHPEELKEAHEKLIEFSDEFETLYVQRREDRIHFVRPCIHTLSHLAPETARVGPNIICSQWVMERHIGNLGEEIKQHSNVFANLAQRGLRRCKINALKAMIPNLEPPENPVPRGAKILSNGYILLRAMDNAARQVTLHETNAIKKYKEGLGDDSDVPPITKWARLKLPNGQIARSAWKETLKSLENLRTARNVQVGKYHQIIWLININ